MKNIRSFVFAWLTVVLLLLGMQTAFASEGERVFDGAGLFTAEEASELSAGIDALRNKMDMDVAIVTTEENSATAEEYADQFYEDNGFGTGSDHSGVLFLIDMDNREVWISTEGKMIRYLTDDRIETILDDAFEYLPDGDYYGAAASFLNSVEVFYEQGIDTNQYNYDPVTGKISRYHSITFLEFLFALAVAVICGLVAVGRVKREYGGKNDNSKLAANFKLSYRRDSSYRAGSAIADVLINSYITQQIIQKQQSSSSGSGGSSTAGRSTTHTSSSGRTHGGGGRKF